MQIEILTREELHRFKSELIEEIKQTIRTDETVTNKQFLRSSEVRKLLKISSGTLQNLCIKGYFPMRRLAAHYTMYNGDIEQLLGEIGNS